jgi:hypothetical protein
MQIVVAAAVLVFSQPLASTILPSGWITVATVLTLWPDSDINAVPPPFHDVSISSLACAQVAAATYSAAVQNHETRG